MAPSFTQVSCCFKLFEQGHVYHNVMCPSYRILVFFLHTQSQILFRLLAMLDNGFFAAWLGCLSAFNLLLMEMKDSSPEHS